MIYAINLRTPFIARIGLDGTLHERTACYNLFQLDESITRELALYNDSPREYTIYDWTIFESDTCLVYHVFDSLLTLQETIMMGNHEDDYFHIVCPGAPSSYQARLFHQVGIRPLDDGSFIETFQYKRHYITQNGACLLKYDKTTHECMAIAPFPSWPVYTYPGKMGYPIGMVKTTDDNIYFAYCTNNNVSGESANAKGWIGIAKLDRNLNIIWQRYCLGSYSSNGYLHYYCYVSQIEDGFAIIGKGRKEGESFNFFYYFIHDEGTDNIPVADDLLRPYLFYPNPAQDQINLQYSPDVQPVQIEFYDLQGRLVCKQSQSLETVDLQGLTAGSYLMKVTLEDGKSYTNKLLKE